MTSIITRDPLLAIAKGILWFLMGVMLFAAAACLVAVPALFVFQDHITIELAKEVPGLSTPRFLTLISIALALVVVFLLLLFRVFQLLKRMVDTVGEGDPFRPDNARRLTQMAWLTLAVQIVTLPIGAIAMWLDKVADEVPHGGADIHIDGGLSGNGLLLVLILFILARVFRQGATMRAELEGTV